MLRFRQQKGTRAKRVVIMPVPNYWCLCVYSCAQVVLYAAGLRWWLRNSCVGFAWFVEWVVSGVVWRMGVKCRFVLLRRMFSIEKMRLKTDDPISQITIGRASPGWSVGLQVTGRFLKLKNLLRVRDMRVLRLAQLVLKQEYILIFTLCDPGWCARTWRKV